MQRRIQCEQQREPTGTEANRSGEGSADPVLTGILNGFLASDNVTAIFSRAPGETVGSYTISAALGPASVRGNYTITTNTASFLIAPLAASVTPNPASKTFGDADPSPLTGTLEGFLAADTVTASYSRSAGETPGPYPISASLSPQNVLGNYAITYRTATFTIHKYGLNACDANNHCTGGSIPNDNGIGGRLTLTHKGKHEVVDLKTGKLLGVAR